MPDPKDKTVYVQVRDKKSGLERQVTKYAYQLIPKRYELLSESVQNFTVPQQKKSEKVVAPAENDAPPPPSIEPVGETQAPEGITVVRKKPGPKPKTNAKD